MSKLSLSKCDPSDEKNSVNSSPTLDGKTDHCSSSQQNDVPVARDEVSSQCFKMNSYDWNISSLNSMSSEQIFAQCKKARDRATELRASASQNQQPLDHNQLAAILAFV